VYSNPPEGVEMQAHRIASAMLDFVKRGVFATAKAAALKIAAAIEGKRTHHAELLAVGEE
jgi:threonine dehydratase